MAAGTSTFSNSGSHSVVGRPVRAVRRSANQSATCRNRSITVRNRGIVQQLGKSSHFQKPAHLRIGVRRHRHPAVGIQHPRIPGLSKRRIERGRSQVLLRMNAAMVSCMGDLDGGPHSGPLPAEQGCQDRPGGPSRRYARPATPETDWMTVS